MGAACAFRPPSRFFASICIAEAVHVNGHKTHVLRIVCNNLAYDYCERPKVAVYLIVACGKSSTDGTIEGIAKVGRNCSVNAENKPAGWQDKIKNRRNGDKKWMEEGVGSRGRKKNPDFPDRPKRPSLSVHHFVFLVISLHNPVRWRLAKEAE